jgi:hypothetical protein
MKFLILLPIALLALIQGAFLPVNLVLLTVLALSALVVVQRSDQESAVKECLFLAFFSGLILDLFSETKFGFSSFWLLVFVYLEVIYSRRFNPFHPLFLPVFIFASSLIFGQLAYQVWLWGSSLILAFLGWLVRNIFVWIFGLNDRQKIRLL